VNWCLTERFKDIHQIRGRVLQTVVKKWFRDRDSGFLDNGGGPDILVHKADLVGCLFLYVCANVEFECNQNKLGLIAKKVKLSSQKNLKGQKNGNQSTKEFRFGVMT
jgi:cold shock CspA family protein